MLCVRRQVNSVMFERKYMPCHNPSNDILTLVNNTILCIDSIFECKSPSVFMLRHVNRVKNCTLNWQLILNREHYQHKYKWICLLTYKMLKVTCAPFLKSVLLALLKIIVYY